MSERVTGKRQMYAMLAAGRFGNTIPQWFDTGEWAARHPLSVEWWGVRTLTPGGPCSLNCHARTVIFFDMDGVLADFVRGAFAFHGRSVPMADVRWDFPQQIGFAGTWVPEFWGGLGRDFWAGLSPLADGFELLRRAEGLVGAENIGLLSSPCDTEGCAEGKRAWVAKHLPDYRKRLFLGSAKELFAGPGKVLVDDHDPNCQKFRGAGGETVLVPRPWNECRRMCDAEGGFDVEQLAEGLAELLDAMQLKKVA